MSRALVAYHWSYIAPGGSVGLFLHGFSADQFATFCITPSRGGNRPGFQPRAQLAIEDVVPFFGTIGRTTRITNTSISNGGAPTPAVALIVLIENIE